MLPYLGGEGVSAAVPSPVQLVLQAAAQHEVVPPPGAGVGAELHLLLSGRDILH